MNPVIIVLFFITVPLVFLYYLYTTLLAVLPSGAVRKQPADGEPTNELHYVFCIPCLNEERVIVNTVKSILQLPYKNLTVIVIDDDSEDETVARVRALHDSRVRVLERKLPNARLGKGESLNYAYQKISKAARRLGVDPSTVIVSIIDGDGRPSLNLLEEASYAFADSQVGAAQSRIRMTNRKQLLPLLQDMEFYAVVSAIQNSRVYLQSVGLGGNGQFSRLSAMQELGDHPWSNCLLEDFDFGFRLSLNGWRIAHLENAIVYQQGLTSIKRFIRQRSRWVQGNMQCVSYLLNMKHSPFSKAAKLDFIYFLCQPWMNLLGSVTMLLSWVLMGNLLYTNHFHLLLNQSSPLLNGFSLFLWLLLVFGPGVGWSLIYYQGIQKDEAWWKCVGAGLLVPLYNLLVLPSVWLAWYRQLRGKQGWIKTERINDTAT